MCEKLDTFLWMTSLENDWHVTVMTDKLQLWLTSYIAASEWATCHSDINSVNIYYQIAV